jgi:peptidoglycan/xylan/chitin deacetylase (PgdA/CDA1 family)
MLPKIGQQSGFALLLSAIVLTLPVPGLAQRASAPVILSFDTEVDADVEALRTLNIQEPATYFFSGEFARNHPDVVARLAEGNTIGSHSDVHADLATLDKRALRSDLLQSKRSIEEAAGRPVEWFRAPFLSYNDQVMEILHELSFRYDSSDKENWTQDHALLELPISADSELLTADFNMFEQANMSDAQALESLKATYRKRAELGRPMVWLMHPKMIAKRAQVLHDFIAFVHQQGGVFQTADQYVASVEAVSPKRWGVWVDFSNGAHDPQAVAEDAARAGITDAFVMARDPEGYRYYQRNDDSRPRATAGDPFGDTVRLLKAKGIRVHAWIPAFHDPYLAKARPEWAMLSENGQPSSQWVSPSRPEVQAELAKLTDYLIKRYGVDGIHLDYFRYPGGLADMSPGTIAAFTADTGLAGTDPSEIRSNHYSSWTAWRADQLAKVAAELRQAIAKSGRSDVELSAALIADAARSFRATQMYGQDYTKLAAPLDLILPMAYLQEVGRPVDWISDIALMTRYRIGNTPMLIGVEG